MATVDGTSGGSPLVGRAAERAAVDAILADAKRGQGGSLVLTGPPGIGKSALVHYAIDVASEFRVVRIAGVESEMAFGYAGVHQVVLPILDHLGELPAPQRVALDAALGRVQHDALDPFLVGLAVLSLVAEAARAQPLLVVIDEAQWLDDESAVALSFVGRRLRAERVAMLVAMRETSDTSRPLRRPPPARPRRAARRRGPRTADGSHSCVPLTAASPAASSPRRRATRWRSSSSLLR